MRVPGGGGAGVRRRLAALNRALVRFETYAVGSLVVGVAAVVILQVLMRYLFAYPNPWSEEASRFGLIWTSLLGASLAVEHRAHFGFDQLTRALGPRSRRAVKACANAVVLAFALLLIVSGAALVHLTLGERSSALNLPVALVYAAAPVSGALMVVHMLAGPARSAKGEGPAPPPAPRGPREEGG